MRSGILAAGNWIVDQVKMIDDYPEQDALVYINGQSSSNGGGPYNVLKDLSLLGADFPLSAAGLVGDDAQGKWIINDCEAHGIDTIQLKMTSAAPTSYTDVMTVGATGRRTFFHHSGTNALLASEDIDLEQSNAVIFYLGYLLLLKTLDKIDPNTGTTGAAVLLEKAKRAGMMTVVDLVSTQGARFKDVVTPSLPYVDVLFLNEYEAGNLLGRDLKVADLAEAGKEILTMGVQRFVVIHTPEAGVAVSADGDLVLQGSVQMLQEEIKGAVGAGDAFAAGFLMGLHEGEPLEVCMRNAVCSAAACLKDPTTSGGVISLHAALAMGERLGFRK
jgi:sugar/nucleoside kinase (ribokinase family)